MRAEYPEGKRCEEALCQAYIKQKYMDIVIHRLTRTFGPTMLMNDTKAISQFIKNGEAYNISDKSCDIRLKDLAKMIADYSKTKVVFEVPDEMKGRVLVRLLKLNLTIKK